MQIEIVRVSFRCAVLNSCSRCRDYLVVVVVVVVVLVVAVVVVGGGGGIVLNTLTLSV